jgi:hypothetical protein
MGLFGKGKQDKGKVVPIKPKRGKAVYGCKDCTLTFGTSGRLRAHRAIAHTGSKGGRW